LGFATESHGLQSVDEPPVPAGLLLARVDPSAERGHPGRRGLTARLGPEVGRPPERFSCRLPLADVPLGVGRRPVDQELGLLQDQVDPGQPRLRLPGEPGRAAAAERD
jgi:hypothetical protein